MFKNLYQLRLLDFFELTAATAGALYIYQSGGWYDWEKTWVIAALSIAALVIWIATRLGKTAPTPGLFLAAYIGALHGLYDLSPWIVVFGRLAIIDAVRNCFPTSLPSRGWQERAMTISLITCFMAAPALFFGCVWASLGQVLQLVRKKWEPPRSEWGRAAMACQATVAVIFLTGLSYYWLRPQIRHVSTIRIPLDIPPDVIDWETARPISPYPDTWTISIEGDLLVLFTDMTLRRFDLSTHKVIDERRLASPKLGSAASTSSSTTTKKAAASDASDLWVRMWSIAPGKLLLHRWRDRQWRDQPLEIHDLTARGTSPIPQLFANGEPVIAISRNGEFVATTQPSSEDTDLATLMIYETATGRRLNEVQRSKVTLSTDSVSLDLEGNIRFESRFVNLLIDHVALRPFKWATGAPSVTEQRSADGEFHLSERGLKHSRDNLNILSSFWNESIAVLMEPHRQQVLLLGYNSYSIRESGEDSALPIVEHLLHDAQFAQPTLYHTSPAAYSTSWLSRDLLRTDIGYPRPQFTPDGRFMIVQNHDRTAMLFHIFAMP